MSKSRSEVLVGAYVLVLAVGFLVFASQFAGFSSSGANNYNLKASFRSAEGISAGTDVRLAGVKVGSVTDMSLNNDNFRAEVELSVNGDLLLPDDTAALIASEGLLGGNFIELIPGGSVYNLEEGQVINDTQGSVSLINLLLKFASGGE